MESYPPEYDVGCLAVKLSAPPKQQHNMTIQVDQPANQLFNRGETITGRLLFAPCENTEFDRVLIDLQAVETVAREEMGANGEAGKVKVNSIARHYFQSEAYPHDMILKRGYQYMFMFSLAIPHLFRQDYCPSNLPLHFQLPPSIGQPVPDPCAINISDRNMSFQYRVRARVTKRIEGSKVPVISQRMHFVKVMPSYPAITLEPETYTRQVQLKQGLLKRLTKGELEVSTSQVPTFQINDQQHQFKLALNFVYRAPAGDYFKPPSIKSLVYRLNAITTSSKTVLDYYPKPDDPAVQSDKDRFETQVAMVNKPQWDLIQGEGSMRVCKTTVEVMLSLPLQAGPKLTPTFFSCLCSRQYELSFYLELQGYASICFNLPAVVSRDRHLNLLGMARDSDPDELIDPVPTYEEYGQSDHIKLEYGKVPPPTQSSRAFHKRKSSNSSLSA